MDQSQNGETYCMDEVFIKTESLDDDDSTTVFHAKCDDDIVETLTATTKVKSPDTVISQKTFRCHECGKTFLLKGNLNRHKLSHTGEKQFSCNECGKRFQHKSSAEVHKVTHMGQQREQRFACDRCGKKFSQKGSLQRHQKSFCKK